MVKAKGESDAPAIFFLKADIYKAGLYIFKTSWMSYRVYVVTLATYR